MNKKQKQIREELAARSNEELLAIWQENDQEAWVPEALKIVEELLEERGVEIPAAPQPDPAEEEDEKLTATQPRSASLELTGSQTILKIARVAKILSWVMLGGWGLLIPLSNILQKYPLVYILATFVSSLAQGALYFFLLQLLGEAIYLLVRIEKNTAGRK
jgi:hypothetical protein